MNEPQSISPRSRLQALLAIPDSQRTEAQWDEINELEISLAPGNRVGRDGAPEPGPRRNTAAHNSSPRPGDPNPGGAKPGGRGEGRRPFKKFHKKPPKETAP